ncbi:MAG: DedA family protein [Ilumatobacteraceae bacterium]
MSRILDALGGAADPWAYVAVGIMAFAEASLGLGLIVPGETLMLFAGFLAWRGDVELWLLIVLAVAGAIIGDSVGFEIGRRYGDRVRQSWLGRKIGEDRWERSHRFLERRGGTAVFLARFLTGPKAVVPALAGESGMEYRRFLVANAASAAVWGTFHVGIGYVAGPSYETVDRYLGVAGWIALGVVVLAALGWWWHRRRNKDRVE